MVMPQTNLSAGYAQRHTVKQVDAALTRARQALHAGCGLLDLTAMGHLWRSDPTHSGVLVCRTCDAAVTGQMPNAGTIVQSDCPMVYPDAAHQGRE